MKLEMIIVFLAVFGLSPALYGQGFPNKPIELVVSSSPGGGIDLIFRLLAEELAKTLKVQVNVVNQPAGAGAIAAEKVAGARKDGYTLLGSLLGQVATMSVANPKAPANLVRDFQPIAILHGYAAVIMLGRADAEGHREWEQMADRGVVKRCFAIAGDLAEVALEGTPLARAPHSFVRQRRVGGMSNEGDNASCAKRQWDQHRPSPVGRSGCGEHHAGARGRDE